MIKPEKVQISPYSAHQATGVRRVVTLSAMRGFTIIEVMIVLAIAALILLVVFLAVPALQRSQRNNARKTDASRVAASTIEFVTNNNASPPTTAAHCGTIKDSAAALSEFDSIPAGACAAAGVALPGAPAANTMLLETMAANGTAGTATTNVMMLATQAFCTAGTSNQVTFDTVGSRKISLLYTVESGTTWGWVCLNVQ